MIKSENSFSFFLHQLLSSQNHEGIQYLYNLSNQKISYNEK